MTYYETEIARKATGLTQFAAYFIAQDIPKIVSRKIDEFSSTGLLDDLIDEDGKIDIEAAKDRALDAMSHCEQIELVGIRFNKTDIQKLYDAIMRS